MTSRGKDAKSAYGRLDRLVIVDAALRIAARPGVTEIRFRDLGAELEADPTAVYRHFRNKHHLMAALIDKLMDEVAARVEHPTGYRELLEAQAEAIFEVFLGHPAIGIHLADARPVGPGELAQAELTLRALENAGLVGESLVDYYGTLSAFALSYVANACREKTTRETLEIEKVPWLTESTAVTPQSHPALARNGEAISAMDFRSTYFSGVRVILDAIDAASRSTMG